MVFGSNMSLSPTFVKTGKIFSKKTKKTVIKIVNKVDNKVDMNGKTSLDH